MSSERQRLRPWLEQQIESGEVPGLRWLDEEKRKFRVTWKHAGKPDFDIDKDAVLFRKWAEHTGKYKPGEQPDPSTWKTRFRCALHKMPDIEEIRVPHSLDENEPFRVFRFKPKPKVESSKQRKNSMNHSFSVPCPSSCPSTSFSDFNAFSYPPPSNGFHFTTMGYNPDFHFPSPPISNHTSSPTNSADLNANMFDSDIDHITPTLPPFLSMPFAFEQTMDHLKPQQPIQTFNDDFNFNNGQYNTTDYEPTLTELQSVSRGEQFSYSGGGSGVIASEGMMYNNMAYNMGSTCHNFMNPGQHGTNTNQQMGLLKMLPVSPPVEMVQEMSLVPPMTSSFGNNGMDISYSVATTEIQSFSSHCMTPARKTALDVIANQIETKNMNKTETIWFCRVYYNNKEVSKFEINSKQPSCRISYENPVKPVDDSSLNQSCKVFLLPDNPTPDNEIQAVLETFNKGLIIEVLHNRVTWVTKICQSKVFLSRGTQNITKLSRDVRTKVFGDRKPNDTEFMVSIGEEPLAALVKLVFVPLQGRTMEQKPSYTD